LGTAQVAAAEAKKADRLVDDIMSTPDQARRLAAWRDLSGLVNDQGWFLWLPAQNLKAPIRDRFANLRPSVVFGGIVWNAEEFFVKPQGQATN